jgi:hypothetical protein
MNDLDERLRDDLAELVETVPLDLGIELDAVIGAGRRARRSRAIRHSMGAAAVTLLGAGVAMASAPLGPSVTPSVVPAAPVTSPAWLENPAYFDVTGLGLASSTDFDRITLDVTAAATGWKVDITTSRSDGLLLAQFATQADRGLWVSQLSPQVAVALLPARTDWWVPAMKKPQEAPRYTNSMHPGTLDLTAVLVVFDKPAEASDLAGFVWQAADGTLVDSLGDAVPSATVEAAGQQATLYLDPTLNLMGYRLSDGASASLNPDSPGWHAYPRLQFYDRSGVDQRTRWVLADVLPSGAHDLKIDLAPDAHWSTVELAGRTGYVIVSESARTTQPVRSLSYVDAAGKRVVWPKR